MSAIQDHIRNICELICSGVGVTARYQFKEGSETHFVEITPQRIFDSWDFEQIAQPLLFEFYSKFPQDSLCFISDDSLSKVTSPEFTITPPQTNEIVIPQDFVWAESYKELISLFDLNPTLPTERAGWVVKTEAWFDCRDLGNSLKMDPRFLYHGDLRTNNIEELAIHHFWLDTPNLTQLKSSSSQFKEILDESKVSVEASYDYALAA